MLNNNRNKHITSSPLTGVTFSYFLVEFELPFDLSTLSSNLKGLPNEVLPFIKVCFSKLHTKLSKASLLR